MLEPYIIIIGVCCIIWFLLKGASYIISHIVTIIVAFCLGIVLCLAFKYVSSNGHHIEKTAIHMAKEAIN